MKAGAIRLIIKRAVLKNHINGREIKGLKKDGTQ